MGDADLATIGFRAETSELERGIRALDQIADSGKKAEDQALNLGATFRAAFAGIGFAYIAREFATTTSAWTDLRSQILNTTKDVALADQTMAMLTETANRTYSSIRSTADSFLANSLALRELGYSVERQLNLNDALNNSLVISGAKGDRAAMVMNSIGRAMAEGTLKTQEFEMMLKYSSRTVEALAAGLGVTTLQLRSMVKDGLITADEMFKALTSQMEILRKEADEMPATIQDGFLRIGNSMTELIGRFEESTGIASTFANSLVAASVGISDLSNNIDIAVDVATMLAIVVGSKMAAAMYKSTTATFAKIAANVKMLETQRNLAVSELQRAVQEQAAAKRSLQLAANDTLRANAITRLAAANQNLIAAQNAANVATASYAKVATASGVATAGLSRIVGFLGGPVGAAITAFGAVAMLISNYSDETVEAADTTTILTRSIEGLTGAKARLQLLEISERLEIEREKLSQMQKEIEINTQRWIEFGQGANQNIRKQEELGRAIMLTRAQLESSEEDVAALVKRYEELRNFTSGGSQSEQTKNVLETSKAYSELNSELEKEIALFGQTSEVAKLTYDYMMGKLEDMTQLEYLDLKAKLEKLAALESQAEKEKEAAKIKKESEKYIQNTIQSLEEEIIKLEKGEEAWIKYKLAQVGASKETQDQVIALHRKKSALENAQKEVEKNSKKEKEIVAETTDAYSEMANRIDESFATIWAQIIDGSENVFDGIVAGFKTMLAEMVHEATTKKIILGIQNHLSGPQNNYAQSMAMGSSSSGYTGEAFANWSSAQSSQGGASGGAGSLMGLAGAMTPMGWAALGTAVAVAAVSAWNKKQDEKFVKMTAEYRQANQNIGTLLGAANEKSDSIANVYQDMSAKYSDMLSVNYGMYRALVDIRNGIAGAAAGFARTEIGRNNFDLSESTTSGFGKDFDMEGGFADLWRRLGVEDGIAGFGSAFLENFAEKTLKEIFKVKIRISDSGIKFLGNSLSELMGGSLIDAVAYLDYTQEKKILGMSISKKLKSMFEDLDEIAVKQLTEVFVSSANILREASDIMGLDFMGNLDRLMISEQNLSLKDLSPDDAQKEIERFFSSNLDRWSEILLEQTTLLRDYQKVGEGAFETMVRLASETNHFSQMLEMLKLGVSATGPELVHLVQNLSELSGGFDKLSSNLSAYYDKFYDEEAKVENLFNQLNGVFGDLEITMPATHEGFKAIIDSLDLTTESGKNIFTTLMGIVPQMDAYLVALRAQEDEQARLIEQSERLAQEAADRARAELERRRAEYESATDDSLYRLRASIDAEIQAAKSVYDSAMRSIDSNHRMRQQQANSNLERQMANFQAAMNKTSDSIKNLTALSNSLWTAVGQNTIQTEESSIARRQRAQGELDRALSVARVGGNVGDVSSMLSGLATPSTGQFGSFADFALDAAITANKLKELAELTDVQLSAEEKMLQELQKRQEQAQKNHESQLQYLERIRASQINSATSYYESQVRGFESIYQQALEQVNAMRGIDDSILSVEDAVENFEKNIMDEYVFRANELQEQNNALILNLLDQVKELRGQQAEETKIIGDFLNQTAKNTARANIIAESNV